MTDALADHELEHGVRRPPRPVMPRIPRLVRTVHVYQAMAHAQIVCWPICRALAERDRDGPVTDVGSHRGKPAADARMPGMRG